jgi:hypothetical protein
MMAKFLKSFFNCVDEYVRLGLSFNARMLRRILSHNRAAFLSSDPKNRKDVSKISTSSISLVDRRAQKYEWCR